jgi:hypothetical protein
MNSGIFQENKIFGLRKQGIPPCTFKIAPRLYMAAARFSEAAKVTPCFTKIAARQYTRRGAILAVM